MKRYIITGIASIGFVAVIAANTNNVQIKPKQELPLPEVILDSQGNKEYKYNVTFEFNIPVCTRDIPNGSSAIPVNYAEDSIDRSAVHCKRCSIGVYSEHEGEEGKSCTYCKTKEKSSNE
jgi:hypothetical protein